MTPCAAAGLSGATVGACDSGAAGVVLPEPDGVPVGVPEAVPTDEVAEDETVFGRPASGLVLPQAVSSAVALRQDRSVKVGLLRGVTFVSPP